MFACIGAVSEQMPRFMRRSAPIIAYLLYLPAALGATFTLSPDAKLIGSVGSYITRQEDTLHDVARENDIGYAQLMIANAGVDPWLPGADRQVVVPGEYLVPDGPRIGIVINLAEQRLYYFRNGGREVDTYPIGTGADAELTPIGLTHIAAKEPNPVWIPPPSIRAERPDLPARILPGPDNPLGDFALRLGWPTYLIHGTNKPYGVGRHVSHGCIRLYPEDISQLYHEVKVGLPVRVIDEKIRLAWVGEELYLAVFPTRRQVDAIELNKPAEIDLPHDLNDRIAAAARSSLDRIDWRTVGEVARSRNGIPIQITRAQLSSEADDTFAQRLSRRRLFGDKR